jgi:Asp-tRNA(Asn)/Glu-tRNA(Gln) amidotransferase A subunit family amidase
VRMSYIHDPDAPGEIDVVEFPSTSSIVAPLALFHKDRRYIERAFGYALASELLSGHPAASVPTGFTSSGLPAGLQIIGPLL